MVAVNYINQGLRNRLTGEQPGRVTRWLRRMTSIGKDYDAEENRSFKRLIVDQESGLLTSDALTKIIDAEIAQMQEREIETPMHVVALHYDGPQNLRQMNDLLSVHLQVNNSRPIADYIAKLDDRTIGIVMHAGYERVAEVTNLFLETIAKSKQKPKMVVAGIGEYVQGHTKDAAHLVQDARDSYAEEIRRVNMLFPEHSTHTLDDAYIKNKRLPPRYSDEGTKRIEKLAGGGD